MEVVVWQPNLLGRASKSAQEGDKPSVCRVRRGQLLLFVTLLQYPALDSTRGTFVDVRLTKFGTARPSATRAPPGRPASTRPPPPLPPCSSPLSVLLSRSLSSLFPSLPTPGMAASLWRVRELTTPEDEREGSAGVRRSPYLHHNFALDDFYVHHGGVSVLPFQTWHARDALPAIRRVLHSKHTRPGRSHTRGIHHGHRLCARAFVSSQAEVGSGFSGSASRRGDENVRASTDLRELSGALPPRSSGAWVSM
jgi:hypothetical protein